MKNLRRLVSLVLILSAIMGTVAQAASREEIGRIRVSAAGDFKYWTDNSPAKKAIVDYVKSVTDKKGSSFIPQEDRIAVFDLDGTLMGETTPLYFEWMMYLHRALDDGQYNAPAEVRREAVAVQAAISAGHMPSTMDRTQAVSQAKAFSGMTFEEYDRYVRSFMETPAEGLTNLKRGEAFYLPMVEVVSYLQANGFTIYIVSGSDRATIRVLTGGAMKIAPNNIIGTDTEILASNQGGADGLEYLYKIGDKLIRGELIIKNLKMNKVSAIVREIGKQPVLAFGNSGGDASMFQYTITGNRYKSAAFTLLCDDLTRELGDLKKADAMAESAAKNGWITISMKDDFRTIYGPNVNKAPTK